MRGHALIVILAAFLLLPVAYVLSVGPVFYLMSNGYLPDWLGCLYLPIVWLCDNIEPVGRIVRWYLSLFGV